MKVGRQVTWSLPLMLTITFSAFLLIASRARAQGNRNCWLLEVDDIVDSKTAPRLMMQVRAKVRTVA